MKPIVAAPLVAIVLAGSGVGAYYAVAGAGSGDEAPAAQPTVTPTPAAQPSPSPTPSPGPTATPAPVETPAPVPTDWLTYVDPTYGYSFEYPNTWFISPDSGIAGYSAVTSYNPRTAKGIGDIPEDELKVEFNVSENPNSLSLEDWIGRNRAKAEDGVTVVTEFSTAVDNVGGIGRTVSLESFGGVTVREYYFDKGGYVYVITTFPANSPLLDTSTAMLQTFKFNR
jgi:hypothetical protein